MPSNFLMFDRIRAMMRSNQVFQAERIYQDQSQLDRVMAGGEFFRHDTNQQALMLAQTNIQLSRLERYKDVEQMDQMGEINLALDLYADEISAVDPERKHTVVIRAHSRRLKRELEEFLFGTLLWDSYCRPAARYLCKFGDFPAEIIPDRNRTGVNALRFMNIYNFTRVETAYGDLVGFFYQDELRVQPMLMHPWQVMHMRLTNFENAYHPYGVPVIDGGRKPFKQLRLMEDAALIYRLTRAPERRKYIIPVGLIPAKEVGEYILNIARTFKRSRFYNVGTGTFDEKYSPIVQEDDIFLPRRPDGSGPDVDVLPGAQNLDQIKDIEHFMKKMMAPTKVPLSRVGLGEGEGGDKPLSQESPDFAKAVQWVQRMMAIGLTKVCIVHLAMKGYPIEDIKGFELAMSATNAMEELYRMETWQTRVNVMTSLKELEWFPKEWIITHFTDLTPDEIQELKEMEAIEAMGGESSTSGDDGGGAGGMLGGGGDLDSGMDEGGDLGDSLGGEESDSSLDLGADQEEGAEEPAAAEQWDQRAQRQVLVELRLLKQRRNKQQMNEYLVRLAERLRKDVHRTDGRVSSYDHMLEAKEFDGLSRGPQEVLSEGTEEDGVLVGWSISREEREAAIAEVRSLLVAPEPAALVDDTEIVPGDLPGG